MMKMFNNNENSGEGRRKKSSSQLTQRTTTTTLSYGVRSSGTRRQQTSAALQPFSWQRLAISLCLSLLLSLSYSPSSSLFASAQNTSTFLTFDDCVSQLQDNDGNGNGRIHQVDFMNFLIGLNPYNVTNMQPSDCPSLDNLEDYLPGGIFFLLLETTSCFCLDYEEEDDSDCCSSEAPNIRLGDTYPEEYLQRVCTVVKQTVLSQCPEPTPPPPTPAPTSQVIVATPNDDDDGTGSDAILVEGGSSDGTGSDQVVVTSTPAPAPPVLVQTAPPTPPPVVAEIIAATQVPTTTPQEDNDEEANVPTPSGVETETPESTNVFDREGEDDVDEGADEGEDEGDDEGDDEVLDKTVTVSTTDSDSSEKRSTQDWVVILLVPILVAIAIGLVLVSFFMWRRPNKREQRAVAAATAGGSSSAPRKSGSLNTSYTSSSSSKSASGRRSLFPFFNKSKTAVADKDIELGADQDETTTSVSSSNGGYGDPSVFQDSVLQKNYMLGNDQDSYDYANYSLREEEAYPYQAKDNQSNADSQSDSNGSLYHDDDGAEAKDATVVKDSLNQMKTSLTRMSDVLKKLQLDESAATTTMPSLASISDAGSVVSSDQSLSSAVAASTFDPPAIMQVTRDSFYKKQEADTAAAAAGAVTPPQNNIGNTPPTAHTAIEVFGDDDDSSQSSHETSNSHNLSAASLEYMSVEEEAKGQATGLSPTVAALSIRGFFGSLRKGRNSPDVVLDEEPNQQEWFDEAQEAKRKQPRLPLKSAMKKSKSPTRGRGSADNDTAPSKPQRWTSPPALTSSMKRHQQHAQEKLLSYGEDGHIVLKDKTANDETSSSSSANWIELQDNKTLSSLENEDHIGIVTGTNVVKHGAAAYSGRSSSDSDSSSSSSCSSDSSTSSSSSTDDLDDLDSNDASSSMLDTDFDSGSTSGLESLGTSDGSEMISTPSSTHQPAGSMGSGLAHHMTPLQQADERRAASEQAKEEANERQYVDVPTTPQSLPPQEEVDGDDDNPQWGIVRNLAKTFGRK